MKSTQTTTIPKTLPAFLWYAVKPQWGWFLAIAILPCAWALDQLAFPYCTKLLIDDVTNYSGDRLDIYTVIAPVLWFGLSVWILLLIIWRSLDVVEVYFIPKLQAYIRLRMFEYIEQHSHKYFANEFSGRLANKILDISNGSWDIINFLFRDIIPVSAAILASIVMLYLVNPKFAIIFILFYCFHMGISVWFGKYCNRLSHTHSEKKSSLQGSVVDSLSNITNVRLFARHRYELQHLNRYQQEEVKTHEKLLWGLFSVRMMLEVPSFIMIVSTVYYLISGWQKGHITAGDFAFVITVAFNTMMSVWRLGWDLPNFFKDIGTCQQALSLIQAPHEIIDSVDAKSLVVKEGRIVFDKVHFHYSPGHDLFKNKNIVIEPGEKVGLVGFSGSGKSTFVNLILRYFDLESGRILIDDQDIAKVTQDSLRENIAMIPQDVTLFHRSLLENIRYGKLNASLEEVMNASEKAHCHEFISNLEQGYDTLVGERGIKLSGGQRQRIAIARAILKNAPILILDEATSALDSVTEKYIQESLNHLMQHRTTIVIAHRLSTLLGMDKILVFHHGEIIEQGDHNALLKQNGHYAKLWRLQAGGFLPENPTSI